MSTKHTCSCNYIHHTKRLGYFNINTLGKKVFRLVINSSNRSNGITGENQFRYEFYRGIWLTVANLGFFHTYPVRHGLLQWCNTGQDLSQVRCMRLLVAYSLTNGQCYNYEIYGFK